MARTLIGIYDKLLGEYGPQGWWPAESRFEVVIGALLTQNTNWKNVERAISNLKTADKCDPSMILSCKKEELEKLIRPSGFYKQKAERLRILTEKYIEIEERGYPPDRDELLDLKGVGKETADSILLYAFDLPFFVIDAYTRRFCSHHDFMLDGEYDEYRSFFERSLPKDVSLYKEFHALIVEWGKRMKKKQSAVSES